MVINPIVASGPVAADLDAGRTGQVLTIGVDGRQPPAAAQSEAVAAMCDRVEDSGRATTVVVHVSGAPDGAWASGSTVAQVNKWEQALRRLEQLAAATVAVATGDCGGPALDALLVAEHRIADRSTRLVLSTKDGLTWPGMAMYRLARLAPNAAAVRRAVMFGTPLAIGDALALHLVHEVTDDPSRAVAEATALAAAVPGTELALRRRLMSDALTSSFEDAVGVHLAACDRALRQASARAER